MTTTIDMETTTFSLSELVSLMLSGSEVILAEGNKPLVPHYSIAHPRFAPRRHRSQ